MTKCRFCGREAAPEFKYCPYCGGELEVTDGADVFLLAKPAPGDEVLFRDWTELKAGAGVDPAVLRLLKKPGAGKDPDGKEQKETPPPGPVSIDKAFPGQDVALGGLMWKVLQIRGEKKLLIAQQSIGSRPFSDSGVASWEESSLRRWLNWQFLESQFSVEERKNILPADYLTRVTEQGAASRPAERTRDSVGILSVKEIKYYVQNLPKENCTPLAAYTESGLVRNIYLDQNRKASVSVLRKTERGDEWGAVNVKATAGIYPVIWYYAELKDAVLD